MTTFARRAVTIAAAWLVIGTAASFAENQSEDTDASQRSQRVIVVVGAPGQDEFDAMFRNWTENWRSAADQAAADFVAVGLDEQGDQIDRDRLQNLLAEQSQRDDELLWIVLVGHGTYDSQAAKFNLRGPDVAAQELKKWLDAVATPTAVINCASASAPFINALSGDRRVVVTSTRSGYELNFARFGQYLSDAVVDPTADLDKDDQVSLLEAFLTASRQVEEFYAQEARLATEHALIDDTGDGLGTPAAWFRGVRATKRAKEGAALDGFRAHQFHLIASQREQQLPREVRQRRDELEREVAALREKKPKLNEDEYYQQLEALLVELARLYASAEEVQSIETPDAHSADDTPDALPTDDAPEAETPEDDAPADEAPSEESSAGEDSPEPAPTGDDLSADEHSEQADKGDVQPIDDSSSPQ